MSLRLSVFLIHRLFDWEEIMNSGEDNQAGEESREVIKELRDVGQQLALAFNQEGSVIAAGGEVGKLLASLSFKQERRES